MQKVNFDQYLVPDTQINLKLIIDLSIKPKIVKLPEESMKKNLCDPGLSKAFLDRISKTKSIQEK